MKLRIVLKDYMHYPEIKALVDKLEAEQAAVEPISLDELDDYDDPESMEESELEELLPRLEHLQDQLYDEEPDDEESEEYEEWEEKFCRVADMLEETEDALSARKIKKSLE